MPNGKWDELYEANRHAFPYRKSETLVWCLYPLYPEGAGKGTNFELVLATAASKDIATITGEKLLAGKRSVAIPFWWQRHLLQFHKPDFAPYKLGPLGRAFGLRFEFTESGAAANYASEEILFLFVSTKLEKIQHLLSTQTSFVMDSSMGPNPDGTRTYDHTDERAVITVGKTGKGKVPALVKTLKGGKQRQVFAWNDKEQKFQTTDAGIFSQATSNPDFFEGFEKK